MRNRLSVAVLGGALMLAGAIPAAMAHHSFAAEFDAEQPVTLKGTITRMEWINPHSWMHIDVENEDGTVTAWMIEGGTPNTLLRRGFTMDNVKVGTRRRARPAPAGSPCRRRSVRRNSVPSPRRCSRRDSERYRAAAG